MIDRAYSPAAHIPGELSKPCLAETALKPEHNEDTAHVLHEYLKWL
jgi:hypothetical protein